MEYGASTIAPALVVAWSLVAIAFCALGFLVYAAVRARAGAVDLEKAVQAFRSLDIDAFRNLVDPGEEAFLRDNLPRAKFREIKRQRAWAALLYAWEAGGAATALARIGQAAQRSSDPRIAASGGQLAENAFRLRMQTVRACFRLLDEVLLPDLRSQSIPLFVDEYARTEKTLIPLLGLSAGASGLIRSRSA